MPADRSRRTKRATSDGVQLTWTTPIDASTPHTIAFAPNVTPGTFNDPPSPVDSVAESALFPSSPDAPPANRRSTHSKKKPENHIPRPPNAFILFRSSFIKSQHVSPDVETNHSTLSKIIGLTWQNLPHEERQIWYAKARVALEEHKRKWPEYSFRPLHTKEKVPTEKRKVREVGPKDEKRCAKIAELLVEGLKGAQLDAAIAEFDRHHVPEIVTRFEEPITARTYRRSSSAPIPDTEPTTFLASNTPVSSNKKVRASSTQPEAASAPTASSSPCSLSPKSEFDAGSEYYSPSFISPADGYPLPASNPSLISNDFSFSGCTAMPTQSCDPLVASCEAHLDIFAPIPQIPYTLQEDAFRPPSLHIDTFLEHLTGTPSPSSLSPLSSMPSTPLSYPANQDGCQQPLIMDHGDLTAYAPEPFDFFSPHGTQFHSAPQEFPGMACLDMHFGAPDAGHSKQEYCPLYDRSALGCLEGDFSSSFLAPMPTYGM